MILVLEPDSRRRAEYYKILEELAERCMVAMSLAELEIWLRDPANVVDLVIGEQEVEADGLSTVVSELVKELRPAAAFLAVTHEAHQAGDPSTHLVSTASADFSLRLKVAVKRTLKNRFGRAIVYRVCDRMNNVASAISGTAQLAITRHGDKLPEAVKKSLADIHGQAMRIGRITRKINDLDPSEMEIIYDGAVPIISFSED
ncbi:hypothetical protein HYZ64_02175 [Candidatus Berkelbacteria bacterium]|nr:hypothetical protein [Candidatus Berkelbacteria bacterium]